MASETAGSIQDPTPAAPAAGPSLIERRHRVLGHHSPMFFDEPLELVRGRGVWVEDAAGRRYLDAYNNVPHVGHCHPHVVEALVRQAEAININTRYLHEAPVAYAERLVATFAPELSVAMLVCTGTEANELALRMARFVTGGRGLIVTSFSYHGNSLSLAEATTGLSAPEALAPHVRAIDIPDLASWTGEPAALQRLAADRVGAAVDSLVAAGFPPAAILIDPLFSTEGLLEPPAGFVAEAVARVRAAGGLYIADEVQSGLGRTGAHMWGHEAWGVTPDIVTMGKSLGNGHPLAAAVTRPEILERFASRALYFNTYGGNPVSAAVGTAVLEVIAAEGLVEHAAAVGAHVRRELEALRDRHDAVARVRGAGLFFGIELVDAEGRPDAGLTAGLVDAMRREGILISRIGPTGNVLKMRPPMPFGRPEADRLVSTLDHLLGTL
ncbi:MAG: aspartate aminotransferase family protein [Amaricoccus sp.]|uniref:aspartate aminotransferase family protein n=1 Tax=Amaricoccus sp. TaxID=1872485 RepID=UPI003315D438